MDALPKTRVCRRTGGFVRGSKNLFDQQPYVMGRPMRYEQAECGQRARVPGRRRTPDGVRLMLVALLLFGGPAAVLAAGLPYVRPSDAAMDADHLAHIDQVVAEGIHENHMPGCVVVVGRRGRVVFRKAYGHRSIEPKVRPMAVDTLFDLASLTKPVATASSIMILLEQGRLRLDDAVADHLPEFAVHGKETITVQQLLTHQGGLIPDNPLADYVDGPEVAWQRIFALRPQVEPGSRFQYTDVGFLVLGKLVERLSGQTIDAFSREHIFEPLGMKDTGFVPDEARRQRAAVTERREGQWIQGSVHDPRAFHLDGVAGHAGLFSTADDLSIYADMMLNDGATDRARILGPWTVITMTSAFPVSSGFRGLGWDKQTGYSSNRGELFTTRAFGHGGFTGTAMWIDPGLDLFVIFLSNRLHPDGRGNVNPLAGRIGTIAAASIVGPAARADYARRDTTVLTGIDVLERDDFQLLRDRNIGLITNQTAINRSGVSTARLLHAAPRVHVATLFSPEHGLAGRLEQAQIADSRHPDTGLPVRSLYGRTRRPTSDNLRSLDALVFDIQDIGTRFYTYISTMGLAMEAAADNGVAFIVLDRPNPIGGQRVSGPVLDAGQESFVAFHVLPVRHGMTVGELAQMFRVERGLDLDLTIVPLEGWSRDMLFDATGLRWVNPSPNIRSLTQALLYPGIGLLETTNLSVGRGTDTPFEIFGAPWVRGQELAVALNAQDGSGVRFVPIAFTPTASKFRGQPCEGVHVIITDWNSFHPIRTGLTIATTLQRLYRDTWASAAYARLLGNERVLAAIQNAQPFAEIEAEYITELNAFRARRTRFLIYP